MAKRRWAAAARAVQAALSGEGTDSGGQETPGDGKLAGRVLEGAVQKLFKSCLKGVRRLSESCLKAV